MSAVVGTPPLAERKHHGRTMLLDDLDAVLSLEQHAHAHPWSRGNFADSLACQYGASVYTQPVDSTPAPPAYMLGSQALVGYWLAMPGVEETHLLNITVAPAFRRQGWAQHMMGDLVRWSVIQQAQVVWLEVRESNHAARALYSGLGFEAVGRRKAYYPLNARTREDAILMRLTLTP